MAIAITWQVESAEDLRRMARLCRNVAQARRLLAIALVMDGHSRTDAATAAGMDRQSLCDWVHRFNVEGSVGLADKTRSGHPARLSADQLTDLQATVAAGPDVETDGVVRWRCVDLQRVIATKYNVVLRGRLLGRILNDHGFRQVSMRPQHPKSDPAAQERFEKTSSIRRSDCCRPRQPANLWRSGFRTRRGWARKGRWLTCGHDAARGHAPCRTPAMEGPTCLAPSTRSGRSGPRW